MFGSIIFVLNNKIELQFIFCQKYHYFSFEYRLFSLFETNNYIHITTKNISDTYDTMKNKCSKNNCFQWEIDRSFVASFSLDLRLNEERRDQYLTMVFIDFALSLRHLFYSCITQARYFTYDKIVITQIYVI